MVDLKTPVPTLTPSPTSSASPLPGGGVVAGLPDLSSLTVAPGGGSGTSTDTLNFTVDLTGLFAGGPGVTTARDALTEFINAARDLSSAGTGSRAGQYVAVQDALLKGGFYSSGAPSFGVVGPDDIAAFTNFLQFAGTRYKAAVTGNVIKDGQAAPPDLNVVGLLNSQAAAGVQYGLSAAARARAANQSIIRHVNPADTAAALEGAYKQMLGRDPTDAEKNAFHAAYDAQYIGPQEAIAAMQDRADTAAAAAAGYGNSPGLPGSGHVQSQELPGTPGVTVTSPQGTTDRTAPSADLDAFMTAISGQESGSAAGNYTDVNPDTGAQGRFQIMPSNWPSWSRQAGLGPNAPRTPQNQDAVARYKMAEYFNNYHNWGAVAAAWYGGPSAGAAYLKDPNATWLNRRQGGGKYPSITDYAASVLSKFGRSTIPASQADYNPDTFAANGSTTSGTAGAAVGVDAAPGSDLHVVDAASLSSAAEQAAKAKNPTEFGAHQIASTFDNFLQLLGGVS